jgi:hypothetical protein
MRETAGDSVLDLAVNFLAYTNEWMTTGNLTGLCAVILFSPGQKVFGQKIN